jgi:glycerophosphoryl diester phosphodiesterase
MTCLTIAHRGGAALMPENTPAAFADALARGCDGAELDVQLSADGEVVVHHDFRLMAGVARKDGAWLAAPGPRIKDLTLAQLRQFDIGRPMPGSAYALKHPLVQAVDGATVPTLKEVLRLTVSRPFILMVELKCDLSTDSADPVALADAAFDVCSGRDNIIFVGFDWRALIRIRERGGACWFTTDKLQGDARPVIDSIAAAGGQGWFPNFPDATPQNVAYARERGLQVGAWTVNDLADMKRLAGLDVICTDRPDLLQTFK